MGKIAEIAEAYVDTYAALHPVEATMLGVSGFDAQMSDYSPAGVEARANLDRRTLRELDRALVADEEERIARAVMTERLRHQVALVDADEPLRDLNVLASPLQEIRNCFDLQPRVGEDDWRAVVSRLRQVEAALAGYRATLTEGLRRGIPVSRRQVEAGARQAAVWAGVEGETPFFTSLVEEYGAQPNPQLLVQRELEAAALAAAEAYADCARWLRETYLPRARGADGVGRERYALLATSFTGLDLDLDETYAWGWEEVRRIEHEMAATATQIVPGGTVAEAVALLDTDPARSIAGVEPFREWMQTLQDRTIAEMQGVHFDIPEPVRRIEARIAPPGGALAMYYTSPSEDFSRPGRTWYPTGGRDRFPLWREVSIAYHEGVPGHHLQIGQVRYLRDRLTRFQRLMAGVSGYLEGWALYAERLMSELGYLDTPDFILGYLSSQGLRAARVVVDLGLHLGLRIPEQEAFHGGEVWEPDMALPFLRARSFFPEDMLASEVDRYLGWPGQAISYKVGERAWLAAREAARERAGAAFDLKAFHARALSLGPMGLGLLQDEFAAL